MPGQASPSQPSPHCCSPSLIGGRDRTLQQWATKLTAVLAAPTIPLISQTACCALLDDDDDTFREKESRFPLRLVGPIPRCVQATRVEITQGLGPPWRRISVTWGAGVPQNWYVSKSGMYRKEGMVTRRDMAPSWCRACPWSGHQSVQSSASVSSQAGHQSVRLRGGGCVSRGCLPNASQDGPR